MVATETSLVVQLQVQLQVVFLAVARETSWLLWPVAKKISSGYQRHFLVVRGIFQLLGRLSGCQGDFWMVARVDYAVARAIITMHYERFPYGCQEDLLLAKEIFKCCQGDFAVARAIVIVHYGSFLTMARHTPWLLGRLFNGCYEVYVVARTHCYNALWDISL